MSISNNKQPLRPSQVARELGVSIKTLRAWRAEQRGPAYMLLENDVVRYPHGALAKYQAKALKAVS